MNGNLFHCFLAGCTFTTSRFRCTCCHCSSSNANRIRSWWGHHKNRFTLGTNKKYDQFTVNYIVKGDRTKRRRARCCWRFLTEEAENKRSRSTPSSISSEPIGESRPPTEWRKYLFGSDRNLLIIFSFHFALRRCFEVEVESRKFSSKQLPLMVWRRSDGGDEVEENMKNTASLSQFISAFHLVEWCWVLAATGAAVWYW